MEISGDYSGVRGVKIKSNTKEAAVKERLPSDGDMVKGKITDITSGRITITTENGQSVSARLSSMLQAQIGDEMSFIVKYDNGMLLEPITPEDDVQKNAMVRLLKSYNLRPTDQNLKILQELFSSGMPLTKDSFMKFNQALKLMGGDFEKAKFMFLSDISLNTKNAEALNNISENTAKISGQINEIFESLEQLSDSELKAGVLSILTGESDEKLKSLVDGLKSILFEKPSGEYADKSIAGTTKLTDGGASETASETEVLEIETAEYLEADTDTQFKAESAANDISSETKVIHSKSTGVVQNENSPAEGRVAVNDTEYSADSPEQAVENGVSEKGAENPSIKTADISAKSAKALAAELVLKEAFTGLTKSEAFRLAKAIEKELPEMKELIKETSNEAKIGNSFSGEKQTSDSVKNSMSFKYENSTLSELEKFLNDMGERLNNAKEYLQQSQPSPGKEQALRDINKAIDHLDVLAQLKQGQLIQIPVNMNEKYSDVDIFSFNDKKAKKSSKNIKSALIALDTANMGHFESYVRKEGRNVSCSFRVEAGIADLVRQNVYRLNELLEEKAYRLESYTVGKLENPFTVLDEEPSLGDGSGTSSDSSGRKLIIDIRA